MNTGEEKFAQTEPLAEMSGINKQMADEDINNVDRLGKHAGIEMADNEELGLKAKLEERDDNRLDIENANKTMAD